MKTLLAVVLIAAGFGAGYFFRGRGGEAGKEGERKILYWYDPMHPAYKADKAGIAPDCGMQLVPKYADEQQAAAAAGQEGHEGHAMPQSKVAFYRDPQAPEYRSDKPGLNPETGNELVAVYEGDAASMAPGTVQVSTEKQQLIGIRTAVVELGQGSQTVRAAGRVMADETRMARVHTRTEGWIEKVFADFIGKEVKQGQPLLTIYSPELLATQQEYLLALKAQDALAHSPLGSTHGQMSSLLEASRRRLELWNLTAQQIEELGRTQQPVRNITVYSPASGFVMTRNAFPNQQVKPETELYTVVDLSRVWILADVFESDLPLVRVGSHARLMLASMPGQSLHGRVVYVQPQVQAETRTVQVRLEAENPRLHLKPEMFVDVEFVLGGGTRLMAPVDAVLDTGTKQTVFLDRGNGFFEPRRVTIGQRYDGRVEILSGLQAGDRIVVSGNFLLDSESQLQSAAGGGHSHD
ncbi:MAG: efflux RND transporter periplasmic adaptor subunit [Bryobacterales bacterium]|nr:efflux RND transporter periplasmic adaptor subunit [Bryobacterales bacterium]